MKKFTVGVVGLGYWGPNLLRNFLKSDGFEVVWGCDLVDENLQKVEKDFPTVKLTKDLNDLLQDAKLDVVVIATPPATHFALGQKALAAGKHLWVEKPFTTSSKEASELLRIAKEKNLALHVDLPFIFHGPVRKIKELIDSGKIGKVYYYNSIRTNLGLVQTGADVVWDLAPHDLSILFHLFPDAGVKQVHIHSSSHLPNTKVAQIGSLYLELDNGVAAYIHLSWLSPVKMRLITIGGQKRMILFDDVEPTEKVKVYDKNITIKKDEITPFKPVYRTGDVWIPTVDQTEALYTQIEYFSGQLTAGTFDYEIASIALKILNVLENKKERT